MDNSYGLEKIQKDLIAGLSVFDAVCRENSLVYSLHGGTLLGAVRNGKMIPWDDDADISMKRTDYEKLMRLCVDDDTVLIDDSSDWIPKFTYVKDGEAKATIDIFIWDNISSKKHEEQIRLLVLRIVQGMAKEDIDYSKYSFVSKILVFVTNTIGKLFSKEKKLAFLTNIEKNFLPGNRACIHRSNDSYKGIAEIFSSDFMDEFVQLDLEGHKFLVMKGYEQWLRLSYGDDYLTPPPESERKPEHGH